MIMEDNKIPIFAAKWEKDGDGYQATFGKFTVQVSDYSEIYGEAAFEFQIMFEGEFFDGTLDAYRTADEAKEAAMKYFNGLFQA